MYTTRLTILLLFIVSGLNEANSRILTNCELASDLLQNGVPHQQIGDWVCLAQHESNFNTEATNHDTGDYGIFQISHLYWCNDGNTPGKGCGVTCSSLLQGVISDNLNCARKIYDATKRERGCGFCAWVAYNQYCSNRNNNDYIKNCNL